MPKGGEVGAPREGGEGGDPRGRGEVGAPGEGGDVELDPVFFFSRVKRLLFEFSTLHIYSVIQEFIAFMT